MIVSAARLAAIYPAHAGRVTTYAPIFDELLPQYDVITPLRIAGFLGQVGHESGQLRYVRELADGRAYEGRADLGNTVPGDGMRFKGRGLIQVTGRANYQQFATAHNVDCVNYPELLEEPRNAVLCALWYWHTRSLNDYADRWDFVGMTKRVNGGLNGLDDRVRLWCNALRELGVGA